MFSGVYGRALPRKRLCMPAHTAQANGGITQDTTMQPACSECTKRHRFSKTTSSMRPFSTKATEQHRLKKQIHKIVHHVRKSKQTNRNAWPTDVRNTWEDAAHNEMWTQHTNMTNETPTSWVAFLIKNLHRATRSMEQHVQRLMHDEYKERRKLFAAKLADDAPGSLDVRTIREPQARPIQFLADEEGTLHTDPDDDGQHHDESLGRGLQGYRQDRRTGAPGLRSTTRQQEHNITDITTQQ